MSTEKIAPGVHRAGSRSVNFYLVEDHDGITVIDAGLPAFWPSLLAAVDATGRTLTDIRAVLITHGHPDHIGLAERLRVEVGADIWVHQADAPMLAEPGRPFKHWKPERSLLSYAWRRPTALRGPLHLARNGALRVPTTQHTRTFDSTTVLDVPGRPTAVPVPGHTNGSVAYVFEGHDTVFTGDAIVTEDTSTGHTGPGLISAAFTQSTPDALRSLRTLATLNAGLVLTGHGEPWRQGIASAVERAEHLARTRRAVN
jgi:glyoxylase-like metal-dependent hydrolase (beta-lactamase superfamily II)